MAHFYMVLPPNRVGGEWKSFQKEWKQTEGFIIPYTPIVEEDREGSTSKDQVLEDTFPTEEVLTKPTNHLDEGED
ncbi:hypothetical protein PVK06_004746 [Gossypium arboreum]|uniref:Uncharacterized protein n=1 Tax=Gossypium arboreum TaxID=29729 RepID=A0ABR0QST8_GOSAR|nr:hypothetical protein PVK06_004746 [Gossypium arboreum]